MTNRFTQAESLVQRAKVQSATCQRAYERSLHARHVDSELLVEIKQILEGLRSALDYCARELYERFGSSTKAPRIYFPILRRGAEASDFAKLLDGNIPGLAAKRGDLGTLLSSFQMSADPSNGWLPDLATLCNQNKHEQLTPQTRRESPELRISSGGAGIRIGQGASISVGAGASIRVGSGFIGGDQILKPGNTPRLQGNALVENIIWVSFIFDGIGRPVLEFVTEAVAGVDRIVRTITAKV